LEYLMSWETRKTKSLFVHKVQIYSEVIIKPKVPSFFQKNMTEESVGTKFLPYNTTFAILKWIRCYMDS